MSGRFITFEGGEGAGKSTQVDALRARLEAAGLGVIATREPGGSPGAEEIRALLVSGPPDRWEARAETLLHVAARSDHVAKTIRPALERGDWVICDRFADSTRAYQGAGHGLSDDFIQHLHKLVFGDFSPDLTFILDLPVEAGLARAARRPGNAGAREDRYERMTPDFHDRLRQAFLAIAAAEPERCLVLDASAPPEAVSQAVWRAVADKFGLGEL
jgi:dTMP kinase